MIDMTIITVKFRKHIRLLNISSNNNLLSLSSLNTSDGWAKGGISKRSVHEGRKEKFASLALLNNYSLSLNGSELIAQEAEGQMGY